MESGYRKKRVEIQPIFSEQENDALRVLAKMIARRHIRNQLQKKQEHTDKESINHVKDNKSSNSWGSKKYTNYLN